MLSTREEIQALKNLSEWKGTDASTEDWDEDVLPEDYFIEHFDYGYVNQCTSIRELKQMIAVLRSGKEGIYEDLEKAMKDRITVLGGSLKSSPRPCCLEVDLSLKKELNEELKGWLETLHLKRKEDVALQTRLEHENTKGNEAMRAGDFKEALTCYNKCISLTSIHPKYYSNASLAYLKLKQFDQSIEMATHALSLSPSPMGQYKCLLRRSSAYYGKGLYQLAMCDLQACSGLLESTKEEDLEHLGLKRKVEDTWKSVDFLAYKKFMENTYLSSTPLPVHIDIVDDSDDEDEDDAED
ncbi:hypothetical protein HMI54_015478 [Coelomomyces lativittatus]|nr:hypothetical protein HMI55_006138 [Coelomomyces lativittatus]KAJ1515531.1 hypothetical protein HMI56_003925 [Coelomomyces lativittatus]KAJ1518510.1 hypothetical protein HMI54_015478 [Coelomomyces lativittatus]